MTVGILLTLAFSLAWIFTQIVWMHVRPAANRFAAMACGFMISLAPLGVALCLPWTRSIHVRLSPEPYFLAIFHAIFLHLLIFFCYVECFYHIERAVTFRMLIEIASHPDGIQVGALKEDYHVADMITARLNVLRDRGFIHEQDGRWRLLPKGRQLARLMNLTLWLYNARSQKDRD